MENGNNRRVAVAMSGGVDSTAAALLLVEAGWEVLGLTLRTWHCDPLAPNEDLSACCGAEDVVAAQAAAAALGIRHYVIEGEEVFSREVVTYAKNEYAAGRTPNPCAVCNARVRFGHMLKRALELGAGKLATGHHARVVTGDGLLRLLRGRDRRKDQSYFLSLVSSRTLAQALFPVGDTTKDRLRSLLALRGIAGHDRAESQDLCFAGLRRAWTGPDCRIVDREGRHLAAGGPAHLYTVGQRRGLALGGGPWYVTAVDARRGEVVVGREEDILSSGLVAQDLNWISIPPPEEPREVEVRIRHRHGPVPARLIPAGFNQVQVTFAAPQPAVTPGQVAAFYSGEVLLGGGIIVGGLTGTVIGGKEQAGVDD